MGGSAARTPQTRVDGPYAVGALSSRDLSEALIRTMPESLRDMPGIMVQKTAHGQGSPYIRGFTGYRNLLLIDGIRLNNSVFRDGPNQYWNTVDPYSLDRIEVVKGPSSVLYGAGAIGGTVLAYTLDPYSYRTGTNVNGRRLVRYARAERSVTGRAGGGWQVVVVDGVPGGITRPVVEHEGVVHGVTGGAERDRRSIELASVDHGQLDERSPTHGHRFSTDGVVDQFMTIENV